MHTLDIQVTPLLLTGRCLGAPIALDFPALVDAGGGRASVISATLLLFVFTLCPPHSLTRAQG